MSMAPAAGYGVVFPGQGSQHVGMLAELGGQHPVVLSTFAEASAVLGYDLWQLIQSGPAEQLSLTHIAQPAILTCSVAIWRIWQQRVSAMPTLMAGHSFGEYSALVCADALDFATAVSLVRQRGEFMQGAVPVGTGTMVAILGLEDAVVAQCCREASAAGVVCASNFNSPGQVVISGHNAAVEQAVVLCKQAGCKRALPLAVSAPFHSPLMEPAAVKFAQVLAGVEIRQPKVPVIQNVGVASSSDPATIKQNLVAQLASPVPWVATMQLFAARGVHKLMELGPGKALAGFNKRIDAALDTSSVNDADSLEKAVQSLNLPTG